jgi:signal transduction histidine kinase
MRRLLDDLLQLSRIGTMNPKREAVPLEEVVDEAINNAALFLRERNIDVQTASDMPMVFAERMRLLEALQNLIDNAVKFMGTQPAPRIWIDCETEEHVCRVLVRDNGIGIDRRYTNKVFDLFEKLDPDSDGSGAGLAIVRRVIETHGGRIDVQSDGPGLGSVFHFTLPLARGANAAQGES